MISRMKNRDWVELIDTLGHDSSLFANVAHCPFLFVGDNLNSGPQKELLAKMIIAMGLGSHNARIIDLQSAMAQLPSIQPKWIITLGPEATATLLSSPSPLESLRGKLHSNSPAMISAKILPTYHPTYLLQNPEMKKSCWEDLQLVMRYAALTR